MLHVCYVGAGCLPAPESRRTLRHRRAPTCGYVMQQVCHVGAGCLPAPETHRTRRHRRLPTCGYVMQKVCHVGAGCLPALEPHRTRRHRRLPTCGYVCGKRCYAWPSSQAIRPFCTCIRLAACVTTTLRSPSITSSVTSSPRRAGRQCMKSAAGQWAMRAAFTW